MAGLLGRVRLFAATEGLIVKVKRFAVLLPANVQQNCTTTFVVHVWKTTCEGGISVVDATRLHRFNDVDTKVRHTKVRLSAATAAATAVRLKPVPQAAQT